MPEKCCAFLAVIGYLSLIQEQMDESDEKMLAIPRDDVGQIADFCDETSVLFESYAEGLRALLSVCEA